LPLEQGYDGKRHVVSFIVLSVAKATRNVDLVAQVEGHMAERRVGLRGEVLEFAVAEAAQVE
jgi:hypothetical protein